MGNIMPPDIQFVRDAFGVQHGGQAARSIGLLPFAGAGNDMDVAAFFDQRQIIFIIEVGQILYRRVEIDIFIVIAFCITAQVVIAAHGYNAIDEVGAAEEEVGGVQGAKRSPAGNNGRFLAGHILDKRYNLVKNIFVELLVADGLMSGMHILVEPALRVDAVDRKHLHLTLVDLPADGVDQLKALVFQKIRGSGGEKQLGSTVVAVDGYFHCLVQGRAVPGVDLSFHG